MSLYHQHQRKQEEEEGQEKGQELVLEVQEV